MRLYRDVKLLSLLVVIILFTAVVILLDDSMYGINNMSGNLVYTQAEIIPVQFSNCSFTLYPGWNMVSFYCLGLYSPRDIVLQSIDGYYGSIFRYVANDVNNDPWKSYNSSLPEWTVQQLTHMDRLSGYWLYIYDDINFSYPGVYADSNISLYTGWNLIGYPNTESKNITVVLDEINFDILKNYNKVLANMSVYDNNTNTTYNITFYTGLDEWLVHLNGSMSNNLTQFDTYRGYWINVTGNQQLAIIR